MSIRERILRNSMQLLIIISAILFIIGVYFNISQRTIIIDNLEKQMLSDNESISKEINYFFSKYSQLVSLMVNDEEMVQYVKEVTNESEKKTHRTYSSVMVKLKNIAEIDENIQESWLAPNALNNYITQDPDFNILEDLPNYKMIEGIWYDTMFETDSQMVITPFYISRLDGTYLCAMYEPVLYDASIGRQRDNIVGTIGISVELTDVQNYVNNYQIGENGFAIIIDKDGNYLVTPSNWTDSSNILDESKNLNTLGTEMLTNASAVKKMKISNTGYYVAHSEVGVGNLIIATFIPEVELESELYRFYRLGSVFLITSLILLGLTFISSKVNVHINTLENANEKLSIANAETNAAFEQLSASEEELRSQFEEIESYTQQLEVKENYIRSLAYLDPLTGIPNRRDLSEKLETFLENNHCGAVMLLDLDNFKEVNDSLGHVFGDKLLKQVAMTLLDLSDENFHVSRFGGDEFLLLMDNCSDKSEITKMAEKIVKLFLNRFTISDDDIFIGLSLGISLYPNDSTNIDELIMYADTAMYDVKSSGKNNFRYFNIEMAEAIQEKIAVEKILRMAIKNEGFELVYQPQIDIHTEKAVGMEALLRIKGGNISPGRFIPVAEETGRIIEMGRWVTEEAIKQQAHWTSEGYEIVPIAVNFSARQLNDERYVDHLQACLDKYNVSPDAIHIEITESIFIENIETTKRFLDSIKSIGIKIALDDFGSGYSSINYLTYMPVDFLKLDKTLCDKLHEDGDLNIIESLISIAHNLKMEAIAEGVEYSNQIELLKEANCDIIQGYYYSKPLKAKDYTEKYYI